MTRVRTGVVIGLLALAIAARLLPGARTVDDAFITFRYARNLLSGAGFVYNPGERVLGTTTPLYTFLIAGLGAIAGGENANFPVLALLVNTLADGLTCLLLWRIGRKLGSEWAGIAAAILWAIAPYSVTFAIGGLETSLYVCLLTGTIWAYLERKYTLAALGAALAFLTRVDALILLGPLGLAWLVNALRKRDHLKLPALLAAMLPVLAWVGFSFYYFGSPFPNSVAAKLVAYRLDAGESLVRLLQHYATPFFEYNLVGTTPAITVGLILYPFLALVGAVQAFRREPRSLAFLLYPWLYFMTFAISNPLIFRWYLTPPLPAWMLLIFLGAGSLIGALKVNSRVRTVLGAALVVLALTSTLSEWRLTPDHGARRPAPDMAYIQLELLYQRAAEVVKATGLQGVLAAGDVGVLGYETGLPVLDLVGLNSPQATQYYPLDASLYVINYAIAPQLVLDEKPEFVVFLEVYGRNGLLVDEQFHQQYTLLERIETDMYGSQGLLIFVRNSEP